MFWNFLLTTPTDGKIIEKARKNLRAFERWGYWLNVFWISGLILVGLILAFAIKMIIQFCFNLVPANRLDFAIGLLIGVLLGFMLAKLAHAFIQYSTSKISLRSDRLLVQYHDALLECFSAMPESGAASGQEEHAA